MRRMRAEDVPEVSAIEREIFADPWSPDSFLAEVDRNPEIGWPVVVRAEAESAGDASGANDGGEGPLIAYAVAWFIVDEIHIGNVAVRPRDQSRGVGRALLTALFEAASRRRMTYATLEVRPSNARAIALYESFGFRRVALRKSYYRDNREDALVMALNLGGEADLHA